ncbi:MAG: NAD(P)-dependent alcohol dehydrogenase [Ignavibacteriales bacterium]|nr:NAD(P)-dependent alcohol dehydrogenase [Ignavibacteriales bacterium]
MKVIIYEKYGNPEVLKISEIEKPVPKENEVLVKIKATSVNYGDLLARNFKNVSIKEFNMLGLFWLIAKLSFGLSKPKNKILGSEFSGIVESIGNAVKEFKIGDEVFGYPGQKMGAYAEYIAFPENGTITYKPKNMTFEEAAVIPMGSIMAINILRKANIKAGQKVLINGASGSIGSAAVQIAKHFYEAEVTGVCGSARFEYVKSLGADKVIDYRKEDFTKNGETYDLIFDVLGKSSFSKCKDSLTQNGIYLLASFKSKQLLQMISTSLFGSKKVICALAPGSKRDLISVKELIEDGKIKSIIDKSFPLEQTAEAHSYVEKDQKKGKVVINVN